MNFQQSALQIDWIKLGRKQNSIFSLSFPFNLNREKIRFKVEPTESKRADFGSRRNQQSMAIGQISLFRTAWIDFSTRFGFRLRG